MRTLRRNFVESIAAILIFITSTFSQTTPRVTISGKVLDDSTLTPLQNVNVFVAHTTLGSSTGQNGQFTIRNIPAGSYEIVASRVGYVLAIARVTVADSGNTGFLIRLKPTVVQVGEVVVTAVEDDRWRDQLKKFLSLFLGKSENAAGCTILNPEVLDFESGENNLFVATARAPLEIENRSLGYHIRFILTQFRVGGPNPTGQQVEFGEIFQMRGFPQFTESKPNGSEDLQIWKKNREKSYEGSLRHFLSCVFRRKATEAGFQFYREPRVITSASNILRRRVIEDDILFVNAQQHERVLRFKGFLEVEYTRAIPDPHYDFLEMEGAHGQVSWLGLNRDSITIDSRGLIREAFFPVVTYGYWAWQRVANALPLDYEPNALASLENDISAAASPTPSNSIIPLVVGNKWTMHISDRNAEGKVISFHIETTQILRDTIIEGERWFVMNTFGHNTLCTNRPDGFYELRSGAKLLRFRYPTSVGDRYQGADGETTIVSVDERTSVPKGSFVCYQYRATRVPGLRTYVSCSPGVGIVNVELIMISTERARYESTSSSELVDYILH